jgi:hypothetical protein
MTDQPSAEEPGYPKWEPKAPAPPPKTELARMWSSVESLADRAVMLAFLIGAAGVLLGAVLVGIGKIEDEGGYLDAGMTYDVRGAGFIIVALALLITPLTLLVALGLRSFARDKIATA